MTDAAALPLPLHPDTEPETDDLVNEFLKRIVEADPELGVLFRAVTVALPVNDPAAPVEPLTVPGVEFTEATEAPAWESDLLVKPDYVEAPDDRVWSRDRDGDLLTARYAESECETHGTESGVLISVNGVGFIYTDPSSVLAFAEWLTDRAAKMLATMEEDPS